jgi:hypothetical protein
MEALQPGDAEAANTTRRPPDARNLAAVLAGLTPGDRLLVWCGNGHASSVAADDWSRWATTSPPWWSEGALAWTP